MRKFLSWIVFIYLWSTTVTSYQLYADERQLDVIRFTSATVDLAVLPDSSILVFTRSFDVYKTQGSDRGWKKLEPQIRSRSGDVVIRRVGRLLHQDSILIVGGSIIVAGPSGPRSALLRSDDHGTSFEVIPISADTLAVTDAIKSTLDGTMYFVDHSGRFWSSLDQGVSWQSKRIGAPLNQGSAQEVDMATSNMGVAIDSDRKIAFTANAWVQTISPILGDKPVVNMQPSLRDTRSWDRELLLWQSGLILFDGMSIFRSTSNDLRWKRWDSVVAFCTSRDQRRVVYQTRSGNVYEITSWEAVPRLVAQAQLAAQFIRSVGDEVILYRSDTGPVVIGPHSSVMYRPFQEGLVIREPSLVDVTTKDPQWGIIQSQVGSVLFDIVRRTGNSWQRDTTLLLGPVYSIYQASKTAVVVQTINGRFTFNVATRTVTPYPVQNPLEDFLKSPISRFRAVVAADRLDSTHVVWAEYRLDANSFRCTETVDSSVSGIRSKQVNSRIALNDVVSFLKSIDHCGDRPLQVKDLVDHSVDGARVSRMLDSIFPHDSFFDINYLYQPPPDAVSQAEDCKRVFKEVINNAGSYSSEFLRQAILAWRRFPADNQTRYQLQFENLSGKLFTLVAERTDEAHLPGLSVWNGTAATSVWRVMNLNIPAFFKTVMPNEVCPQAFKEMSDPIWLYLALGAYVDGMDHGRWHRWSDSIVAPDLQR